MPFKIASHGGRYLYVDQNNEMIADNDYDLSRTPQDLASKGDTFEIDDKNRLTVNNKPVTITAKVTPKGRNTKFGLMLEQANSEEYVIRTADRKKNHRYVFAGIEKLKVQDEPNAMAMFSVVEENHHTMNEDDTLHHHPTQNSDTREMTPAPPPPPTSSINGAILLPPPPSSSFSNTTTTSTTTNSTNRFFMF
ncbi:hypothetical protein BDA99DRAFT_575607 [Phascolomyces articulosus]|uniref:Uncharacterized protein n=1 Tax=Phascolomyces articulosus TaxID=60185 RepID=A0AAD5JQF4_9FUNG|nr:hypothetical protein BDA99DRAFT_575607 [Phascolomyces articulosus]